MDIRVNCSHQTWLKMDLQYTIQLKKTKASCRTVYIEEKSYDFLYYRKNIWNDIHQNANSG